MLSGPLSRPVEGVYGNTICNHVSYRPSLRGSRCIPPDSGFRPQQSHLLWIMGPKTFNFGASGFSGLGELRLRVS